MTNNGNTPMGSAEMSENEMKSTTGGSMLGSTGISTGINLEVGISSSYSGTDAQGNSYNGTDSHNANLGLGTDTSSTSA